MLFIAEIVSGDVSILIHEFKVGHVNKIHIGSESEQLTRVYGFSSSRLRNIHQKRLTNTQIHPVMLCPCFFLTLAFSELAVL